MRVVPLVCFPVSICVLFDCEKLGGNDFSELLVFHALGRQLRDVKGTTLIVRIGETMGTVVLSILETQFLCGFVHFLKEKQNLNVVSERGMLCKVGRLFNFFANENR